MASADDRGDRYRDDEKVYPSWQRWVDVIFMAVVVAVLLGIAFVVAVLAIMDIFT